MTKATSWFWNSTLPSASTICTSPASVGIQARLTVFSVSAVMTATTPGTAAALAVSIFFTRACACSRRLRVSRRARRMLGSGRSFCGLLHWRRVELVSGVLDGFDDVLVAGAAAKIAGNAEANFFFARRRVLPQQPVGAHDHARRAEAALQSVHFTEALLQRVQRAVGIGHALDGANVGAIRLHREHGAGFHRLAVEIDRAGAAMAGLATDMRTGEIQLLA